MKKKCRVRRKFSRLHAESLYIAEGLDFYFAWSIIPANGKIYKVFLQHRISRVHQDILDAIVHMQHASQVCVVHYAKRVR